VGRPSSPAAGWVFPYCHDLDQAQKSLNCYPTTLWSFAVVAVALNPGEGGTSPTRRQIFVLCPLVPCWNSSLGLQYTTGHQGAPAWQPSILTWPRRTPLGKAHIRHNWAHREKWRIQAVSRLIHHFLSDIWTAKAKSIWEFLKWDIPRINLHGLLNFSVVMSLSQPWEGSCSYSLQLLELSIKCRRKEQNLPVASLSLDFVREC
jgi:hypothetical protein